jgi:hypothetical protein
MNVYDLRKQIHQDEFDYQVLIGCLGEYKSPRDRISDLLEKEEIVRIKKGLYVFGDSYRRKRLSREVLANLIYGPSYISLEYALQYHGLIPEAVETVTSVTSGRSRSFNTPLGSFTYRQLPLSSFQVGMDRVMEDNNRGFLIATPEKALADKVFTDRGTQLRSLKEMREYLFENLRIDPDQFRQLDPEKMNIIADRFRSRKLRILSRLLVRDQNLIGESI